MSNSLTKTKIKEARKIRRMAEIMWSHLSYENDLARSADEQGLEPRPSSDYAVFPTVEKVIELSLSALVQLPDDSEAIKESRIILKIMDDCLSQAAPKWDGPSGFDDIFEEKASLSQLYVEPLTAGQYYLVALFLKNKNDLALSKKYLDKALAMDSKISQRIF